MSLKKILLVDDEQAIRDLLQLILESEFDNEIVFASSGNEAVEILKQDSSSEIGMILSDYNMPNGNGGTLYQYNNDNRKIPFILITGGFLEDYPEMEGFSDQSDYFTAFIPKPFDEDDLFNKIKTGLNKSVEKSGEADEYVRVNIDIFLRQLNRYQPDLFIKLNDGKVVKIFTSKDLVEGSDLEKYKNKNLKEVFLTAEDFKNIKDLMKKAIFEQLQSAQSADAAMSATSSALNFVVSGARILGIDSDQVALVEQSVESCLRNLEKEEEFTDLLKVFRVNDGYLVSHSITTLHLCYMVLKKAKLYTIDNMQRLSYAALLHDFDVKDDIESAIIDKDSKSFLQLDDSSAKKYLNHPIDTSELISHFPNIPSDCQTIIKLHHENPDGSGFPRGIGKGQYSVLAATFNLCLRVADHLYYNQNDKQGLIDFVESLSDKYSTGPFKSPYAALCELLK
jgi:response regulator RpfG family c-di-GMP phosphodiesterase